VTESVLHKQAVRVTAIVVSFQPRESDLARLIRAVAPQVEDLIVIDNGSDSDRMTCLEVLRSDVTEIVHLGQNFGIAYAHNVGIRWAEARRATHVLLLDQDSEPAPDMVATLLAAESELLHRHMKVGAVGPVFYDARLDRTWPFYVLSKLGIRPRYCPTDSPVDVGSIPCDLLITSGSLIRLPVLQETGPLNEGFFIEHVDTEWSLRARAHGFLLFGVCSARMYHTLGDAVLKLPFTRRTVQLYRPQRYYYMFRNAVLLWRLPHAPLQWKINEIKRLLLRIVLLGIFAPERVKRLRMMGLGLWHGLIGRTGRLEVE
jgi:rhamnosyltransferase